VILRRTTDACNFNARTVKVTMKENVITVDHEGDDCSPPGAPIVADIQLGALPAGNYRVDVWQYARLSTAPAETLTFQVLDPVQITVFPPPARPLTNYTGLWYNAQESGWGLSLHQGATWVMFGVLFVYDGGNRPEWYSIQGGQWTSSTQWSGTLFRTTGPAFSSSFDASQVAYSQVGSASLDFTQVPGQEGRARFTYSIGNTSVTKTITRLPL